MYLVVGLAWVLSVAVFGFSEKAFAAATDAAGDALPLRGDAPAPDVAGPCGKEIAHRGPRQRPRAR